MGKGTSLDKLLRYTEFPVGNFCNICWTIYVFLGGSSCTIRKACERECGMRVKRYVLERGWEKKGTVNFFSTCSSSYPRWVQHVWKGTPGLESRPSGLSGTLIVNRQAERCHRSAAGRRGEKGKCQILKVSQRIKSTAFLTSFIWKRTRNRPVVRKRRH